MDELVITIDGPAGVGKSTVAQLLAAQLGISFLDTGAMYRAVTLAAMRKNIDLTDEQLVLEVLDKNDFQFNLENGQIKVNINGTDVTDDIRKPDVTASVRYIASASKLRTNLVEMQRQFARQVGPIVTEGRDQGTVAFADADFKFFLTADSSERAGRRQRQLMQNGMERDIEQIQNDIEKRDAADETRSIGPLKPANDAIVIDTTNLNAEQVLGKMLEYVKPK